MFLWRRLNSSLKSLDTNLSLAAVSYVSALKETTVAQNRLLQGKLDESSKKLSAAVFLLKKLQKTLDEATKPQQASPYPLGVSEEESDIQEMMKAELVTIEQAQSLLREAGLDPDVTLTW
jgi:hypothetical protein